MVKPSLKKKWVGSQEMAKWLEWLPFECEVLRLNLNARGPVYWSGSSQHSPGLQPHLYKLHSQWLWLILNIRVKIKWCEDSSQQEWGQCDDYNDPLGSTTIRKCASHTSNRLWCPVIIIVEHASTLIGCVSFGEHQTKCVDHHTKTYTWF